MRPSECAAYWSVRFAGHMLFGIAVLVSATFASIWHRQMLIYLGVQIVASHVDFLCCVALMALWCAARHLLAAKAASRRSSEGEDGEAYDYLPLAGTGTTGR